MTRYVFIYKRGTRIARIAKNLALPVAIQTLDRPDDWLYVRAGRNAIMREHLNWGSSRAPKESRNGFIKLAVSKVRAFEQFTKAGVQCPRWSRSFDELVTTLSQKATIFGRKDGLSGGRGIEVIPFSERGKANKNYDFFVERISHQREFRVHVFNETAIAIQAKQVPPGNTNPVHSYENGAAFTTLDLDRFLTDEQKEHLIALAIKAVSVLGLFFGAADIILSRKDKFYVLEVNTAPGIRSDVIEEAYTKALRNLIVGHGEDARPARRLRNVSKS